ncbi:tRNA 4-thiouridine(8) synthase ThiI [bacterium]|nr:tRNA 4-thiouridine(8) synthase ThiI [bacterium]
MNYIVIRYSELALKGKNRNWFENLLMKNIRKHLSQLGSVTVSKVYGRIIIENEAQLDKTISVLKYIPGIANFSIAHPSTHEMESISEKVVELFDDYLLEHKTKPKTFKIQTRRSSKDTPMNSQEISAAMGGVILDHHPELKVDLHDPNVIVGIEIWAKNRSIIYIDKIQGQGGLPVGSAGTVISFISGGIDSPVAAWFMMKRGCTPVYLHFHSYPFIGEQSRQKVIDLVTHLSRYQPNSTLIIVPFADIQKAVRESCEEKNRTIIYRRLMYKVGEALKRRYKAMAYVTGEAVGQVASQTLENLACTEAASTLPVLRPLIGMDKAEITEWAKRIGTYEISIQPFSDCCTVFQPRKPEIRGIPAKIVHDEKKLDLDELIAAAVENVEILKMETKVENKFWSRNEDDRLNRHPYKKTRISF